MKVPEKGHEYHSKIVLLLKVVVGSILKVLAGKLTRESSRADVVRSGNLGDTEH